MPINILDGSPLTMRHALARTLSIIGHPLCVVPVASLTAMAAHDASAGVVLPAVVAFAAFALIVLVFSWLQVRSGRWQHVDASQLLERRSLNYFLATILFIAAFVSFRQSRAGLSLGFLVSGLLIVFAITVSAWVKPSLHVAFSVFSAALLWRVDGWLVAVALCFVVSIAWSRLALRRHSRLDVITGAIAGGVAGWLFWLLLFRHAG